MLNLPEGVAIITEPLNMILGEKLKSKVVPTGVISMTGELKSSVEERDGVKLSAPEDNFLDGSLPCRGVYCSQSWNLFLASMLISSLTSP